MRWGPVSKNRCGSTFLLDQSTLKPRGRTL
jgi:hypothetical protein